MLGIGTLSGLGVAGARGGADWTPAKLSPLAWYVISAATVRKGRYGVDADEAAADGDRVGQWKDLSGNNNHLTNGIPDATGRPLYRAAGYVESTVGTSDIGDFLSNSSMSGTTAQPLRVFALAQHVSVPAGDISIWTAHATGATKLYRRGSTSAMTADAGGTLGQVAGANADTDKHLHEVLFNGASSAYILNGVSVDTGSIGTNAMESLALFGAYRTAGTTNASNLKIWEVLVLQGEAATSAENAARVRSYFSSKFGIYVAGLLVGLGLQTSEVFGSGLTVSNPSSYQTIAKATVTGGAEFLFVGDQDMPGAYGTARRGSVHVWKKVDGDWTYHEQLLPDGANWTGYGTIWMGHGIAASGDWLACGNTHERFPTASTGEGYVELWKHNSGTDAWEFTQRIQPDAIEEDDEFGLAVDIDGDWMVVGAPYHAVGELVQAGSVWIYENVDGTWTERQVLTAETETAGDQFGISVHIKGEHAFVNDLSNSGGALRGRVSHYQLVEGTWTFVAHITPTVRPAQMRFGWKMRFDGTTLAVSGWGSANVSNGGLHIFTWNGSAWSQAYAFLDADNPLMPLAQFHRWGESMDMASGIIVCGARFAAAQTWPYNSNDGKGAVYVFRKLDDGNWYRTEYATGTQFGDYLGEGVMIDGSSLLVVSSGAVRDGSKTMILSKFAL